MNIKYGLKKLAIWFVLITLGLTIGAYLFLLLALKLTASGAGFPKETQEAVYAESLEPHQIKLIDNGSSSLYERLQLIANAKKTIELEFFIFNIDRASRLVTQALLQKAKEGVKIRLLVDFSAPVFQLRPVYAKLMENAGVEIKYYNTSSLYRLFAVQHRSHRKLLIVDGDKALTGGRNIGDDYFDLSDHYNFLDSDVLLQGPVVKTILSSFNLYWSSDFSVNPRQLDEAISSADLDKALAYINLTDEDKTVLKSIQSFGAAESTGSKEATCNDVIFVTDFPGLGESHRKIFSTISSLVTKAKNEIYVESPYFVLREEGYNVFKSLTDRNLKVTVLTNGLYSTDAFYIVASLWKNLDWIAALGIDLFVYSGKSLANQPAAISNPESRWGIHAKRAVLDSKTVLIGTYNIDPRSANLNSELMVVCRNNPAFAKIVLDSIQSRISQSQKMISGKSVINADALTDQASFKQKLLTWLIIPIATSFDFIL